MNNRARAGARIDLKALDTDPKVARVPGMTKHSPRRGRVASSLYFQA